MRGIVIIGGLLLIWIFYGIYNQHQINTPPYVSDEDDIGVMSGYNHIHVSIEEHTLVKLDVYNKDHKLSATYTEADLQQLYPAGVFIGVEEKNGRLYTIYKNQEGDITHKKLIVGARGTLQFAHERK